MEEEDRRGNVVIEKDNTNQNVFFSKNYKGNTKQFLVNKNNFKYNRTNRFDGSCYTCGKRGHKSSDCFKNKSKINSVMTAVLFSKENESNPKTDNWYLDSGATTHMCHIKDLFLSWSSKSKSFIETAGGYKLVSHGTGNVKINILDEYKQTSHYVTLTNVSYVPDLNFNLISISEVTKKNFNIIFKKNYCRVMNENNICVIRALKEGNLYGIKTVNNKSFISKHASKDELIKWHQRLGHLNFRDVYKVKGNVISKIPENLKCIICEKSKIHQLPFQSSETKQSNILEVVHSDICGPLSVKSVGGAQYFATFIDGKSRYIHVSFLK